MATNYRSKMGNAAETDLARELEVDGWLVASRRHTGGAGDLMAVKPSRGMLVEVKTYARGAFRGFGPDARRLLLETAEKAGLEPYVAWRPYPSRPWRWYGPSDWPRS